MCVCVGILLWELWTGGKTPYPAFTNPQVLDEVRLPLPISTYPPLPPSLSLPLPPSLTLYKVLMGYRLEKPKACPSEVYDLMWRCWIAVRIVTDIIIIECIIIIVYTNYFYSCNNYTLYQCPLRVFTVSSCLEC